MLLHLIRAEQFRSKGEFINGILPRKVASAQTRQNTEEVSASGLGAHLHSLYLLFLSGSRRSVTAATKQGTRAAGQGGVTIFLFSSGDPDFDPAGCMGSILAGMCPRSSLSFGASSTTFQLFPTDMARGFGVAIGAVADCFV